MSDAPPSLPRVSDYVHWHAERTPDAVALALGGQRTTYLALHLQVERLARALLAAGIRKGDRVATLQTPHPDYLAVFLATASIGAIWVGLNPRYRLGELVQVITDAEPRLLFTRLEIEERSYVEDIAALRAACPELQGVVAFEGEPAAPGVRTMADFLESGGATDAVSLDAARAACGGADPCLIVYTSGSTGTPKGALLRHAAIVQFSLTQNELWPVAPHRGLNYFPINHIGCVVDCSMPCLVAGGLLVFMEHFDVKASLQIMAQEQITIWLSVPGVFQMQVASPGFRAADLSAVQLIVWEGAAMPAPLIEELRQICPRLATNYGMTETTSAITVVPPTDDVDVLGQTVGTPFPGVEVRLADPAGRVVADGQEGEVQARSPYNLMAYWRRPDATAAAFTDDGFFRTGDLAIRRPDGRYRLVGRLKEMYKSGGYNVYPREIEEVLERHPAVAQAAVVAAPDPVWQEVGVAYVVLKSGVTVAELDSHCRRNLANFKVPKSIVVEQQLPLLPIGKVDKPALAARAVKGGQA